MLRPGCPTPAAVERFAADLAAIFPAGDRLGIAVSGGPDSMALLLLAHAVLGGNVDAATIDHGLRPESGAEAAMVADLCRELGIAHETMRVDVPAGNVQSAARKERYRALNAWAARRDLSGIATAHHADDQAETLLMRLNRGSGLSGLAGIRAKTQAPGGEALLVRPLLDWRKAELLDLVTSAGVSCAEDPSNRDAKFDRVAMRRHLVKAEWLDPAAIARSARHLGEAELAIAGMTGRIWNDAVIIEKDAWLYFPGRSPPEGRHFIHLEIVRRILGGNAGIRGNDIARAVDRLSGGDAATLGGHQARVTERDGETAWIFTPESPRRTG
ncbi:tRNA lysidine(34) synthetase TilS [Altererythrobacter sp. SALINAS58]|uniref:tRNA lysidine(34) synthetase TilS n=1 Tax=Alteripontixanthobacter muriae TaxID=2705546 RepID=UPI00157721E7|nr:tRNA lysidine(34) synthetase TilS [Alteripontixanthobacter muriae]NTZ42333.1 tRNA lysidine(34) synthetase TilS [Alteripontixanthobacter muriae]